MQSRKPKGSPVSEQSHPTTSEQPSGRKALAAGGVAAILASACSLCHWCWSPSGSAVPGSATLRCSNRSVRCSSAPRPLRCSSPSVEIYRPAAACKPGEFAPRRKPEFAYEVIFWGVAALVGASVVFP